jgi:hypothetical protein
MYYLAVPIELQPPQGIKDRVNQRFVGTFFVRILDTDKELSPVMTRKQVIGNGHARRSHMQVTGGRWCNTNFD